MFAAFFGARLEVSGEIKNIRKIGTDRSYDAGWRFDAVNAEVTISDTYEFAETGRFNERLMVAAYNAAHELQTKIKGKYKPFNHSVTFTNTYRDLFLSDPDRQPEIEIHPKTGGPRVV
jgi:hypothetical protein